MVRSLAEKQLDRNWKGKMACLVLTGVGCCQWDSNSTYVLKNHLKSEMMKGEVTNCYIRFFYLNNPILCSLVLQESPWDTRGEEGNASCKDTDSPECCCLRLGLLHSIQSPGSNISPGPSAPASVMQLWGQSPVAHRPALPLISPCPVPSQGRCLIYRAGDALALPCCPAPGWRSHSTGPRGMPASLCPAVTLWTLWVCPSPYASGPPREARGM